MFANRNLITKVFVTAIVLLQVWLIYSQQLFGDEAFYWLESQYLGLSYSELPGWTAWMIRIGTNIFGNNYFAVRIVSYLGFFSVFIAIRLINLQLLKSSEQKYLVFLSLAIPLFALIAVMALPDIWLVVFVIWVTYFLIKAVKLKQTRDWVFVGVLLACGLNVHVRMWIWMFVAGVSFLIFFYFQKDIIRPALLISFPLALLGIVPILIFNTQHEFALFVFQFGSRHPWQFQLSNFSFLLSQFVVITPIVLYLWINNIAKIRLFNKTEPVVGWIILTAFIHWVLYVVMSLFADGLRTTVHWALISYVPVIAISGLLINTSQSIIKWSFITGGLASISLLIALSINNGKKTNVQARILDNSVGWYELSIAMKRIQKQQNVDNIIADYFMTAAELAFELNKANSIKVLPHAKNIKHGRQKQLDIMGLLIKKPDVYTVNSLLVVEDSTLKLQEKAHYYTQLCDYFNHFKYLETINISNSNKQFHVFNVNQSKLNVCDIPPLFYVYHKSDKDEVEISGWVIKHQSGIKSLSIEMEGNSIPIELFQLENKGIENQFPEINDPNEPNNGFEIIINKSQIIKNKFNIMAIGNDNKKYLSQTYYLE